ncbi:YD repeat-containing protein [Lysobacter enzymogenes]|uniref:putative Ig domain-containing protein n=1 Tax=Lysobacter enzymogenes TaxID=69 RepID=UPI00339B6F01
MAAVISGNGLGLFNGSFSQLGQGLGSGRLGQGRDSQYVNIANGNLVLRSQDESLVFRGLSVGQVRTYNSQGQLAQVGADGWLTGYERRVELLSGVLNQAGSVMRLHTGDGAWQDFEYVAPNSYRSTAGDGAHDTLTWTSGPKTWTYVEGSTRREELYADHANATLKGRLTRIRDLRSDAVNTAGWDVVYDGSGRISQIRSRDTAAGGNADAIVFGYDANGRLSSLSTRENGVLRGQVGYEYDAAGRLSAVLVDLTPQDGAGDRDAWDAGQAANNDGYLFRTVYTYADATSLRIVRVEQSDGSVVSYSYDASGRVRTVTQGDTNADDSDGIGQTLTFSYDPVARSTDVSDSTGRTWTYLYDAAGQLIEARNPAVDGLRDSTAYSYDAAGNLTASVTRRGGNVLSRADFAYDANGNLISQWQSVGAGTGASATLVRRTYTANNQLESETVYTDLDPDGAAGPALPGQGLTTRYVYDGQNRVRFVIGPNGEVGEIEYAASGNGVGQPVRSRQYLGDAYAGGAYTLTALSDWAATRKGASQLSETSYDLKGRLAQSKRYAAVDASGNGVDDDSAAIVNYVYDAQGLLRQQTTLRSSTEQANDGRNLEQSVAYVYDGLGRLLSETLSERRTDIAAERTLRTTTWRYEDSGHAIKTVLQGGRADSADTSDDLLRIEVRDGAGQLISLTETAVSGANAPSRTSRNYYDSAGRLRASEDANGARSYFFYDGEGQLAAQVDGTGTVSEYTRDALGRVVLTRVYATGVDTAAWLVDGKVVKTLDQIRPATSADDREAAVGYDDLGRVLSETDALGVVTRHVYDALGRLLQSKTTGSIDGVERVLATRYFYDDNGRQIGRLDAEGYLTEYLYDRAGRRAGAIAYANPTDPAQRDAGSLDQLRPQAHAGDQRSRAFYDGLGNLIAELDAEGGLTEYVYDEARNQRAVRAYALKLAGLGGGETLAALLAQAKTGIVRESRRSFDAAGRLEVERNADGLVTRYTYDAQGRVLTTALQPDTLEVREHHRRYDVFGNLVAELNERLSGWFGDEFGNDPYQLTPAQIEEKFAQLALHHEYDALGRRIQTTDQAGNKTWFFYDAAGQLSHTVRGIEDANGVRNALGEVVQTRYTAFGQVRDSTAYTQRIVLDPAAGREGVADSLSTLLYTASSDSRASYLYDKRGQQLRATDAEGYTLDSVYDAFGRLRRQTRQIDANRNHQVDFQYDLRGLQLSAQERSVGAAADDATRQVARSYDAFGRVTQSVDARGQATNFAYDRMGRQILLTQAVGSGQRQESMSYDALGRVLTKTDAFGNVTTYSYDEARRSMKVVSAEGVESTTTRNVFGETASVADWRRGEPTETDWRGDQVRYVYDDEGRVIEVWKPGTFRRGQYFPSLMAMSDASGNYNWEWENEGYGIAEEFAYDERGLLVSSYGEKAEFFTYDAAGRLQSSEYGSGPGGSGRTTLTHEYDGQGRRIATTNAYGSRDTMRYDRNGRLLETVKDADGLAIRTQYVWDAAGQQLSVTEAAGSASARTTVYAYDGLGRRIAETVAAGSLNLTTHYLYDAGDNVIARIDPEQRTTRFVYDAAGRQIFAIDSAGGVVETVYDIAGRPLATRRYANAIALNGLPQAASEAQVRARLTADDARDQQRFDVYDRDGRVKYSVDGAGAVTYSHYNRAGQVDQVRRYSVAIALTAGLRSQLAAGEPAAEQQLATWATQAELQRYDVQSFFYNQRGALELTVDADMAVTETTYDWAGRLIDKRVFGERADYWRGGGMNRNIHELIYSGEFELTANEFLGQLYYAIESAPAKAESYAYDGAGRVDRIYRYDTTESGNSWDFALTTSIVYDDAGRMVSQTVHASPQGGTDSSGRYSLGGQHEYIRTSEDDRTTRYVYDAAGRQRFVADGTGAVIEYRYNAASEVVQTLVYGQRPSQDFWAQFAGEPPQAPSEQQMIDALAGISDVRVSAQSYDDAGRVKTRTDANQKVETYEYDGTGLVLSYTNRDGYTWSYGYDAAGRRNRETSPPVTVASADAAGNVAVATRAVVARTVYDALGNVLSRSEDADSARPRTTEYVYDNRGNQIKTIFPDAGRLDANGNFVATGIRPTVEIGYDVLGRAVVQKDVRGNYSHKVYDLAGRVVYEIDQERNVTGYKYNAHGEQIEMRRYATVVDIVPGQPLERETFEQQLLPSEYDRVLTTRYDNRGNKTQVAQAGDTRRTDFGYNAFGELVFERVFLSGDRPEGAERDPRDSSWDSGTNAFTHHFYDKAGRRVATIDAMRYVTTWSYSAAGEVLTQTEHARQAEIEYDWRGLRWTLPPAGDIESGFDRTVRYGYDALGRKTSETVQRHYQYLDIVEGKRVFVDAVRDVVTTTAYDNEGHALVVTADGQATTTAYDALGRVRDVTEAGRDVLRADARDRLRNNAALDLSSADLYERVSPYSTMVYDAFGNLVQLRRYANGLREGQPPQTSASDVVHTTRYDWQGRDVWERDSTGVVYTKLYDAADNLLSTRFILNGNGGQSSVVVTQASYDRVGRQVTTRTQRELYLNGAPLSQSVTDTSSQVRYNAFGEIVGKDTDLDPRLADSEFKARYEYDNAGNLLRSNEGGVWRQYSYDGAGRQTASWYSLRTGSGPNGAVVDVKTENRYDRLGRVTQQTLPGDEPGATGPKVLQRYDRWGNVVQATDANGNVTDYRFNDFNQVVLETKATVKVVNSNGTEGDERPVNAWYYDAIGRLVGQRDANGNVRNNTYDAIGQVAVSQDGTGAASRSAYDVFGQLVLSQNAIGYITFRDYDRAGRVTAHGDFGYGGSGRVSYYREQYALNERGDRLSVTNAAGKVTAYDYDSRSKVLGSRSAAGVVVSYGYDLQGNKIRETNALSDPSLVGKSDPRRTRVDKENETVYLDEQTWDYDFFGRLIDHNDLGGVDYDYIYDSETGQLVAQRVSAAAPSEPNPGAGQAPEAPQPIVPDTVEAYKVWDQTLPPGTFVDPQNEAVRFVGAYRIGPFGRDPLPTWLAFDASTGRFLGVPPGTENFDIEVVAVDASGHEGSTWFHTSFAAPETNVKPPVQNNLISNQVVENGSWSFDASSVFTPAPTVEGTLTYTAMLPGNLASGATLSFDPATQAFSGSFPTLATAQVYTVVLVATDSEGASISQSFTVTVPGSAAQGASAGANAMLDDTGLENPWIPGVPMPVYATGNRQMTYYANGRLKELREDTNTGQNWTKYGYDANGNRTSEEIYTYDADGKPLHIRTTTTYDAHNRIVRVTQDDIGETWRNGDPPPNAGFEDGDVGWIREPGWEIKSESQGGDAYGGSWSAEYNGNGPARSIISNVKARVQPGQVVTASVMVQQGASDSGDAAARVFILWLDADGNWLPGGEGRTFVGGNIVNSGSGGRWHPSSVTATVPPGAVYMSIAASAKKSSNKPLWVDNFSWSYQPVDGSGGEENPVKRRLMDVRYSYDAVGNRRLVEAGTAYNPAGNPPVNAGFESGDDTGWDLQPGWTVAEEGNGGDANTGSWSGRFDLTGSGTIISKTRAPVSYGQIVNASVMVQQGASSEREAGAQVMLVWFDQAGNRIGASLGNMVDSGSGGRWHPSKLLGVTVPPGAATMAIGAYAYRNGGGDPLWVDDFAWSYKSADDDNLVMSERYWFDYDAENRVTVANGAMKDGHIVVADDDVSYALSYDAAGRATRRRFMKDGTLMEQVTDYDLRDQRTTVWEAGAFGGAAPTVQAESFSYDEVGRQTKHRSYDGSGMKTLQSTRYDDDGRVVWQANFGRSADGTGYNEFEEGEGLSLLSKVDYTQTGGYDDAGRLQGYVYGNFRHEAGGPTSGPGSFTHTYSYSYEGRDSYLERGVYGYSNNSNFKASNTSSSYDAWGRRIAIAEQTPNQDVDDRVRYFAYDGEGNILRRREGRLVNGVFHQGTEEIGQTQIYAYVGGQQVASGKYNGELDIIGRLTAYDASETGSFRVTVLAGDTLRSIAQRVYGNANLWYLLAEANAVGDDGLVEGTTIVVPNATVSANDSSTFKPFNPNDAIGNTAPTLPYIQPPPKKHCGGLAMVLMIVVAVVVTVYTAGAAATWFAGGASAVGGAGAGAVGASALVGGGAIAGTTATLGTAAAIGGAAVGGFVGSVASQVVGKALGAVDSFSLRGAVASGLTAGITAGVGSQLGSMGQLIDKGKWGKVAASAALTSAGGYVANRIAGIDTSFSWRGIAASAVSAVIGGKINQTLGTVVDGPGISSGIINDTVGGLVGGVVSLHTRRAFGFNDPVNYGSIAVDAFGNALGNAVISAANKAINARIDKANLSKLSGSGARSDTYSRLRDAGAPPSEALRWAQENEFGFSERYQYTDNVTARAKELGFSGDITDRAYLDSLSEDSRLTLSGMMEEEYDRIYNADYADRFGEVGRIDYLTQSQDGSTATATATGPGYFTPKALEGFSGSRLQAGIVMSNVIDKGQLAMHDIIQAVGPTTAVWGITAASFAMGGPVKTTLGLAFDAVAGDQIETLRAKVEEPVSGFFATNVFAAQTEPEIRAVDPVSDTSANVSVSIILTVLGAVGAYGASKAIVGRVKGYRAAKAEAFADRKNAEVEFNANRDNVAYPFPDPDRTVTMYRVDTHGFPARIAPDGTIPVVRSSKGERALFVNIGDLKRARDFAAVNRKGDATITAVEVDASFLTLMREKAVYDKAADVALHPSAPLKVDIGQASNQFGLRRQWHFDALRDAVRPHTVRTIDPNQIRLDPYKLSD